MKTIIILLAFILNGCAVYLVKCDCPQRDTVYIVQKNLPLLIYPEIKPSPYSPYLPYIPDSIWFYPGYRELNTDANIWEEEIR